MLAFSFSMLRAIFTSFLLSLNLGYCLLPTQAQVVGDRTLDSQVDRVDDRHLVITGGKEAGPNLFHSFSEFSVPSKSTVYFNNNVDIANIFSRVTGGSISNIDGLIKANNASLFLLNPAGIIFGPNAQLDLGGSFIATTAEAIVFSDGIEFSATNTETEALLTVNIPIGLQYGKSPGAIISNGVIVSDPSGNQEFFPRLSIDSGNTIALVGGEVLLRSTSLETDAAKAEIGSVSAREFVTLQSSSNGWSMNYDSVNEFSKVELFAGSRILSGNGGSIQIRGKEIEVRNSIIENLISREVDAGDTNLIATDLIEIDSSFILTQVGVEGLDVSAPIINKKGGDIFLEGKRINFSNNSIIFAGTTSLGKGGNINIHAKDLIELSRESTSPFSPFISTTTKGEGAGGKIEVNTGNLLLQDGGQIQAATEGEGAGGKIVVNTGNLLLQDGGQIRVDSFGIGGGAAGTINVNATGSIEISGTGVVPIFEGGELESGFFATTESGTSTREEINLTAKSILLRDNGTISAEAYNKADGGNINIDTETLVLFNPSEIRANAEEGKGGNIQINTKGVFAASGVNEQITASSEVGFDGVVDINTPDVDSEIEGKVPERSPLAVENLIYTGCSLTKDYISSQFQYIGRGGLPFNPLETIITEDAMVDLGSAELSAKTNKIDWSNSSSRSEPDREIREATNWIVNQKGNVELIASTPKTVSASACQFNSSR